MAITDIFQPLDEEIYNFRGEARDNIIRNLLTSPDFADMSQAGARNLFRNAGFSFRDSSFNQIFNEIVGVSRLPGNIGKLGLNTVPAEGYFNTRELPGSSRVSLTIRYNSFNPNTGNLDTKFSTLYSDDVLTIGEYLNQFDDLSTDDTVGSPPSGARDASIIRGYMDRKKF